MLCWMKVEAALDASFISWIQPILKEFHYDAECFEELGLKFLKRKAKKLQQSSPCPVDLEAAFSKLKETRAIFLEEIEEARQKAIEVDEMAGSKRSFPPRDAPNPENPHDMILYYHKESRYAFFRALIPPVSTHSSL